MQATNTTLRDSNSFLQEQLAKADAELAQLRTTQRTNSSGAANGSGAAASGGANAAASSGSGSGDSTATGYELTEGGGRLRAAFAGEASYEAMKQRLDRDLKVKVQSIEF